MVTQHANKLAINWQGPKRIVRTISDWVFEVESLNPPQVTTTHHVSRLRFYAEASRGVTEDLLQYALHSQGRHLVEDFRGVRFNEAARRWEVEVKWLGLEAIENTLEPYLALQSDVPVLLDRYWGSVLGRRPKAYPPDDEHLCEIPDVRCDASAAALTSL
ncbi:unnamed protein product [Phytophthora fragariaefolia]|uniref:Unnamed protein product n=1 Tax=Phytophthora fragariaefolia TaxID=1490495 RepID=A0A9W7D2K2_9STRA|nr:unnamed protein product [Phytophthora fragariaefolia]